MYTEQGLARTGRRRRLFASTTAQKQQFDEQGFFIVEGALSREDCKTMSDEFERVLRNSERDKGGHEVHVEPGARRVSNIFDGDSARTTDASNWGPCLPPPTTSSAESEVQANLRDPVKGYGAQDLHVDVPKHFEDDWWMVPTPWSSLTT